jgi:hypothetical protein
VKINIIYYSTYALSIAHHLAHCLQRCTLPACSVAHCLPAALHTGNRLHSCLSYGHITKMAEAMAAAITVRLTPPNPSSSGLLFAPIFSRFSFNPLQAAGNHAAIFQVLHTYSSHTTRHKSCATSSSCRHKP